MIILNTFLQRRKRLLENMIPGSAALFFAAPEVMFNSGRKYPFRQNSNFWYFSGFDEPEALLILIKSYEGNNQSVLFNRVRDKKAEIWLSRFLGQKEALERLGVDCALPWTSLEEKLYQLLNGLNVVYHAQGEYDFADRILFTALSKLRRGSQNNLRVPNTLTDWRPWVHEMRLLKEPNEQEILRQAGKISLMAHTRAMQVCHPGMFEYQLAGEIHHEFTRHGAHHSSYETIVGSGKNACILHYTENGRKLRDGDLVLIDAGCEFYGYSSDITRTFPINGKFSNPQREIYDIVLASLKKALSLFRPGIRICEIDKEVARIMITGLVKLKIMQGDTEQLIAENAHRKFFMHGLSHWVGLDVHDIGKYGIPNRILEEGMVLAVEPGLYIAPDSNVAKEYHGIGVRIEDDILITELGNENLTDSLVKEAEDIESLMAEKHRV